MTRDRHARRLSDAPSRYLPWLVVLALVLAGCGGNATHQAAVLDGLTIPAGWELVHTTVMEHGGPDTRVDPSRPRDDIACDIGECSSMARYYLVAGKPADIYPAARRLVTDAGFEIRQDSGPTCDLWPGGPACSFDATRSSDLLLVDLFNPGDAYYGIGASDPGRSVVRMLAEQQK